MTRFRKIPRPDKSEYPAYSHIYMDLINVDDDQILDHLYQISLRIRKFIGSLPEEILTYRYAAGKWTIKEILVHLIDDERIFTYRALTYARNEQMPLQSFEQDDYARHSCANERNLESILDEYEAVRASTLLLFQYLPEEAFLRSGSIIDKDGNITNKRTVRAIAYHIAGHELRHIKLIKERYLKMTIEGDII